MKINKFKAIMLSAWYLLILILKGIWTKLFYPIPYLAYNWVMQGVVRKSYTRPENIFKNPVKWFLWLHYDDDQLPQGAKWYQTEYCHCECDYASKLNRFICAYRWSAWRNPMYNVNYNYFGNQSPIISHKISFGSYKWNKKLRCSNGDNGFQLVWFITQKQQNRFIFSVAKRPFGIPITFYFGWNPNTNGRFTVAGKFK